LAADLLENRPRFERMRAAARTRAEGFALGPIVDQYEAALMGLLR
jgi:hypothetical protein